MNSHRRLPRVAVVERFRLVSQALVTVLSPCCEPTAVPAQSLHSADEVRRAVLRGSPDIVLLGCELGAGVDVEQLVQDLAAGGRTVIARARDAEGRARLRWAGARVALGVDDGVAAIREAIARIAEPPPDEPPPPLGPADPGLVLVRRLGSLSRREVDVLAEMVQGRTAAEIARAHVVSELTVRTQVKAVLRKLGVDNQLAAVAVAQHAVWEPPYVEAA